MSEVKWIKLSIDTFNDTKIKVIRKMDRGDTIYAIWTGLLMLAGQVNDDGLIYFTKKIPYTTATLSDILLSPIDAIECALKTFESFGMIEFNNGIIRLINWEKHQNMEKLKEIRDQKRLAKQKERTTKKRQASDKVATEVKCLHTELELELDKELELYKKENINTKEEPNNTFAVDNSTTVAPNVATTQKRILDIDSKSLEIAQWFRDEQFKLHPNIKSIARADITLWAKEVDKLCRLDRKSYEQIQQVLKFVLNDKFWNQNVISLRNIRKPNKDGISKFESVQLRLTNPIKKEEDEKWKHPVVYDNPVY